MSKSKPSPGIDVRHRKACRPREPTGKCCGASFQAHAYDKRATARRSAHVPEQDRRHGSWRARRAAAALRQRQQVSTTDWRPTVSDALDALSR